MTKNDGGPAFPSEGEGHGNPKYHSPGMTLRDWFAGMAMSGTVNYPDAPAFDNAAKYAYQMADAMLKAREVINTKENE